MSRSRGGGGLRKCDSFVTGGRGGKDHVTSHFQFFHNSQFNVLFDILSYIVQIEVANINFQSCKKVNLYCSVTALLHVGPWIKDIARGSF